MTCGARGAWGVFQKTKKNTFKEGVDCGTSVAQRTLIVEHGEGTRTMNTSGAPANLTTDQRDELHAIMKRT